MYMYMDATSCGCNLYSNTAVANTPIQYMRIGNTCDGMLRAKSWGYRNGADWLYVSVH